METNIREQFNTVDRYTKLQDDLFQQAAKRLGITNATLYVLIMLYTSDRICTQNDFVDRWFYPKQTISFTVNKLVTQGMAYKRPLAGSKNKKAVSLTEDGKIYCQKYISPIVHAEDAAFVMLTKEERQMLVTLTEKHYKFLAEKMKQIL